MSQIPLDQALTSLRILVCVAKSDGRVDFAEREAILNVIETLDLPQTVSGKELLDENNKIEDLLPQLTDEDLRLHTYVSAYALANSDRHYNETEQKMVKQIADFYKLNEASVPLSTKLIEEARETLLPSAIDPIADPVRREKEIAQDITKYAILSAVLGAFPVPGVAIVTDLAVVGVQVKMFRDIGQYYGHKLDEGAVKGVLAGIGLGTGARIAVNNICKLIPVWGSVVGAMTSFAATYALGQIAIRYFDSGMKADLGLLSKLYKQEQQQGKTVFAESKEAIAEKERLAKAQLQQITADLSEGRITQEEYIRRAADLK